MPDIQTILRQHFAAAIAAAFGPEHAQTDPLLRPAASDKFGDIQANVAMSLGKTLGQKPRDVAQKIVAHLQWKDVCAEIPAVAGLGFINLRLAAAFLAGQMAGLKSDPRMGVGTAAPAQTVVVDYSQPNVAKEMHVGHLRSTIIGDCLARVLGFLGHKVIRQNHMGDWGTQFGMLIEHIIDEGWEAGGEHSIGDLNALYQAAKRKFDADPAFADRARRRVVLLQGGDERTLALWRLLMDESKVHFNAVYERLGVLLTDADIRAESFYNPLLPATVAELEKAGLARESQGALCTFPPGFQTPEGQPQPLIIRKSDGGYLYATTDLAAIRYRVNDLHADRIVYVTDARQKQHFAMVFKTAEMAGWMKGATAGAGNGDPHPSPLPHPRMAGEGAHPGVRIEHVPFGTVLGEDGKPFKTRSGDTVKLADLLDEAVERALKVVTAKNPELPAEERQAVARAVGIGAVKYADLCNDRVKDYVFSWDRMLSFDGNTAPYLQYSYVRVRSIFRKGEIDPAALSGVAARVEHATERALALKLLQFPAAVEGVADSLEPHRLCTYLFEVATMYHQFYEQCPVLTAPDAATRDGRLVLSDLTARTLKQGLELLGIAVVEQM